MKTIRKKVVGLSITLCALSLMGAMVCISSPKSVSAETDGLTMIQGAAVRLAGNDEGTPVNGLRFEAQMTQDYYQDLQGSEVVLYSKATANGVTTTVDWVLKSATDEVMVPSFNSKGIAKFYHTLNFNSLFGEDKAEQLKQANAFSFDSYFQLVVDEVPVWTSQTETRSMRQVAYKAYNTPDTEEEPNVAYLDSRLHNYFTDEGATNKKVYSVGGGNEDKVSDAVGEKAYADYDGMFIDVSDKTMEDLYNAKATYVVFFDENNVVSKTPIKWPDKLISTAEELSALLTEGKTKAGSYYVLANNIYISQLENFADYGTVAYATKVTFNGVLDGNGYSLYVPQRPCGLFGNLAYGAAVKNIKIVADVTTASKENDAPLTGNLGESHILSVKSDGTYDNVYVKLIGDSAKIQQYGFSLINYDDAGAPGTFTNLVVDYSDMLPNAPSVATGTSNKYNSLFAISSVNGTMDNIHIISTTTDWMEHSGKKTVADYTGVTLHTDIASISATNLNAKYWDTRGAYPVWKSDRLAADNQVVWSANSSTAYVANGLLSKGEDLVTVKDVLGTVYYENGDWKNTGNFPEAVGDATTVRPFYKAVEVEGSNGTKVTAIMTAWNRAIKTETDLDFIAPNTTLAGKYIMVDNVSVSEWTHGALGDANVYNQASSTTNFNGVFDGNGYTLTFPQRGFGLFGNIGNTAVVKNVYFNVTARTAIDGYLYPLDMTANRAGLLARDMGGAFENIYVTVSGTTSTNGIGLVAQVLDNASMTNVVLDYGDVYDKLKPNNGGWKGYFGVNVLPDTVFCENVYVISSSKYFNERGKNWGYTPNRIAENETNVVDGDVKLIGVRRYDNVDAIKADDSASKVLTGFSATFWDTTSGAPIWKNK